MDTRELVESIGGPALFSAQIAKIAGKAPKPEAIRQWASRNTIPHKWRIWAYRAARNAKISVTREEIGVEKL